MHRRLIRALIAAWLLTLVTGCSLGGQLAEKAVERAVDEAVGQAAEAAVGQAAEAAVEQATGVQVEQDGDQSTVSITNEQGETITFASQESGQVPDGYPLPVLPGARVNSSSLTSTSDNKVGWIVEFAVPGDIKEGASVYEQALRDRGLTVTRTDTTEDGQTTILIMADSETESGWITLTSMGKAEPYILSVMFGDK